MIKNQYMLIKDVQSPMVTNTNRPNAPTAVRYKTFKAGSRVSGEMQMKDGKPCYLIVAKTFVIPAEVLKLIVLKDVTSNADGKGGTPNQKLEKIAKGGNPTIKYLDAGIVGAALGFGAVWLAEKKQWIKVPDKKNTYIGLAIGAGLAMYVIYRIRNK